MKCLNPQVLNTQMLFFRLKKPSRALELIDKLQNGSFVVPCGKCYKCRRKLAREHAIQIAKEIMNWPQDERFFITMTYRNANLPYKDGHFSWFLLERDKKRLIATIRNLNRYYDENKKRKIKKVLYYLVFELSPEKRPHFHMIICGHKITDLSFHKIKNGHPLFVSKSFSKIWKWGHHEIGMLNTKTAAYCAGYVMKKCDKNYDYTLEKYECDKRTIYKWQSPGWGLKWALSHIDEVKNNPKYHTKYWSRKVKEWIIANYGENAYIKYLKHNLKSDQRTLWQKWTYWQNWANAWRLDNQIKRVDKL